MIFVVLRYYDFSFVSSQRSLVKSHLVLQITDFPPLTPCFLFYNSLALNSLKGALSRVTGPRAYVVHLH